MIKSSSQKLIRNQYPLTPEEMYQIVSGEEKGGIIGYHPLKKYFDYQQIIWEKKREKILKSFKSKWPPLDWKEDKETGKRIPPKKTNFTDDAIKLANSFYDSKRAEEIKNELESKNRFIKDIQYKSDFDIKKNEKDLRKIFKERENEKKKIKEQLNSIPEYKINSIDQVKDKIKNYEEQKEKNIKRGKPTFSKCDRVTIVAEAEFVGEQIPFYNTAPQERELKKKLFYPDKTPTWKRAPAWKYPKATPPSQNIKDRDDAIEEKVEEYLSNKGIKRSDLNLDIPGSFYKVKHHGEIYYKMAKKFNYDKEEQYQTYIENNPKKYVGPQHYWRMPKETFNKRGRKNKSAALGFIEDDKGNKVFYMDRKKTDKRVFTAGMRKAVY